MNIRDVLYMRNTRKLLPRASIQDKLFGNKLYDRNSGIITTATGNPVSIVTNKAQNAISTLLSYSPKQSGSGDPSPQNIRPIEGWTEANLMGAGKNLLDIDNAVIVPKPSGISGTDGINFIPQKAGTYTVRPSVYDEGGRYQYLYGYLVHSDGTRESAIRFSTTSSGTYNSGTFVCVEGDYIFMNCALASGGSSNWIIYSKPQVELGSQATAYEPFITPTIITESLGDTYYGFSIDLERGVLRVTHAIKTYTGASGEQWNYSERDGNRRVFIILDGAKPSATDFWANIASGGADSSYPDPWKMKTNGNTWPSLIIGVDNTIGSANDWKALLAETNMVVVYPLEEPLELPLTHQIVALLAGNNTIWCDGDNIEITYKEKK